MVLAELFGILVLLCIAQGANGNKFLQIIYSYIDINIYKYVNTHAHIFLMCLYVFPTLGVGLLDFKVSYYSSPAETTSWSAQPHRLP